MLPVQVNVVLVTRQLAPEGQPASQPVSRTSQVLQSSTAEHPIVSGPGVDGTCRQRLPRCECTRSPSVAPASVGEAFVMPPAGRLPEPGSHGSQLSVQVPTGGRGMLPASDAPRCRQMCGHSRRDCAPPGAPPTTHLSSM